MNKNDKFLIYMEDISNQVDGRPCFYNEISDYRFCCLLYVTDEHYYTKAQTMLELPKGCRWVSYAEAVQIEEAYSKKCYERVHGKWTPSKS